MRVSNFLPIYPTLNVNDNRVIRGKKAMGGEASSNWAGNIGADLDRLGLEAIQWISVEENSVISPLSMVLALGLVGFACRGDDRARLLEWLGIPGETSDDGLAAKLKFLGDKFKEGRENSMFWGVFTCRDKICQFPETFANILEKKLCIPLAISEAPNVSKRIVNDAVEEGTRGSIQNFLSGENGKTFFVNSIYLKREWGFLMMPGDDCLEWYLPDSSCQVTFLGSTGFFKVASTEHYQYLSLPLKPKGKEMEIFMTTSRNKLPCGMSVDDMTLLRTQAQPKEMAIYVPNFEIKTSANLTAFVCENGIVFHDLELRDLLVLHDANIRVEVTGIEAAAATVVVFAESVFVVPPSLSTFWVNMPFIFTIRSGAITEFVGFVYKPVSPRGAS